MGGGSGAGSTNRRFSTGFQRRSSIAVGNNCRQTANRRQSVIANRRPSTPNQVLIAKAKAQQQQHQRAVRCVVRFLSTWRPLKQAMKKSHHTRHRIASFYENLAVTKQVELTVLFSKV